ncbi:hypothetical protein N7G274_008237 [Stereocaulon virgatum]|uniref:Uncharacterized protein n=1 Tax=Stereocaulon virgatum TaxID=373712 RepID=A0ABR4A792_9LECA
MDMCYTEVEWSGKYNGGRGGKWSNEKMEGYEKGTEEHFFVCGTDDEISPADPAAQGFVEVLPPKPVSPARLNDASFE